jgi:hypothetical protein
MRPTVGSTEMRSRGFEALRLLMLQLGGAVVLSGCAKSVTVEHDEALDQRVVRTSETVISVNKSLCEHEMTLDAARVEGTTPPDYGLVLGISGSVWVRPSKLTVTVDGEAWTTSESTTTEFGGACPEQSSVQMKFGVAAQGGCVFKESYWYPVPVAFLRRLGSAREVIVRVDGLAGHLERQFSPENSSKFSEFVATHVPADSVPRATPGS